MVYSHDTLPNANTCDSAVAHNKNGAQKRCGETHHGHASHRDLHDPLPEGDDGDAGVWSEHAHGHLPGRSSHCVCHSTEFSSPFSLAPHKNLAQSYIHAHAHAHNVGFRHNHTIYVSKINQKNQIRVSCGVADGAGRLAPTQH